AHVRGEKQHLVWIIFSEFGLCFHVRLHIITTLKKGVLRQTPSFWFLVSGFLFQSQSVNKSEIVIPAEAGIQFSSSNLPIFLASFQTKKGTT
ncbi:MAG: hypothetical protein PHC52_01125, partial [Syntrophales bacterium]|nr:hypothetical protein [Syntrophales bacterium]